MSWPGDSHCHGEPGCGDLVTLKHFINGEFVPNPSGEFIDSFNPSTGTVWAKVPRGGKVDVDKAVEAAKNAYKIWSKTAPQERSRLLMKVADILESRLEDFCHKESADQGKPIWLARKFEIPRAVYNFRVFASSLLHELNTSNILPSAGAVNYTTRSPIGVAGLISPWNLPLYLLTFKMAPALAAGNTVVAKPSEMTSVTAWKLCGILIEAGIPPGVVNMVFGLGAEAGEAIVAHPDVPVISFTGSTPTAAKIRSVAAPYCKRMSLELGGKNPGIIFADADLDTCIATTLRSCFQNQGEICLCTSRVFVQEGIYQQFLTTFIPAVRKLVIGDPSDENTFIGPLISKEHLEKVKGYVEVARQDGGVIECGHGVDDLRLPPANHNGYYMLPTVITGLSDQSRCMQEEIFGPVACIVPFKTEEEVIVRANNVQYGLCASVWSRDNGTIHRVSQQLQVGTVWANCWLVRDLNMPFGGVKNSGLGSESTHDSYDFYTDKKTICVKYE